MYGVPRLEKRSKGGGRSDKLRPLDQTHHHNKGRATSTRDARTNEARTTGDEWGGMRNARRTAESHCTKERPTVVLTARHDHAVLPGHQWPPKGVRVLEAERCGRTRFISALHAVTGPRRTPALYHAVMRIATFRPRRPTNRVYGQQSTKKVPVWRANADPRPRERDSVVTPVACRHTRESPTTR